MNVRQIRWAGALALTALALSVFAGPAFAAGELRIFNWANYTSPELISKFEQAHGVKVTIEGYDSNEQMLAAVEDGESGYDIVVPTDYMVAAMIEKELLAKTDPKNMKNFVNVLPEFVDVYWDPGRAYSVPWQWGTTGVSVNREFYAGDIDSWSIIFDPPEELAGKINVMPEMNEVMNAALFYKGFSTCNANDDELRQISELLTAAKENWSSIEYDNVEKLTSKAVAAAINWNGASMRARLQDPAIEFGYPVEGMSTWMDNVVVLAKAPNLQNAKLFQNFIMEPENAALISRFARYSNGIDGSDPYIPDDMKTAPEIVPPDHHKVYFVPPCPRDVTDRYARIWDELLN